MLIKLQFNTFCKIKVLFWVKSFTFELMWFVQPRWPEEFHTYWAELTNSTAQSPSTNARSAPCVSKVLTWYVQTCIHCHSPELDPLIPLPFLSLQDPAPPPLTFPISQHSWAVPHQSKAQFMGLILQRAQTAFWDRMFGWFLALLKQTSPQNMIKEGRQGVVFLCHLSTSRPR